jgi:hypothetical protein
MQVLMEIHDPEHLDPPKELGGPNEPMWLMTHKFRDHYNTFR